MSDQAVPTPSQTVNQDASLATQPSPARATTAAEARQTAILAAYDILRPAGEVDSRTQGLLVSALALIALCVVPDKPSAISFGGLSFSLRNWLALAIPLSIIVLYMTADLAVAWGIQWKRVSKTLAKSKKMLGDLAEEELRPLVEKGPVIRAEVDAMEAKRKEIWGWYQQRAKEVDAQNLALEQQDRYPGDSLEERQRNAEAVRQEFERRNREAGITAFDEKVDRILKTGYYQDLEVIRQNKEAFEEIFQFLRLKKIRLAMGLIVPMLVSAFSLLTFAWIIHTSQSPTHSFGAPIHF